MESAKPDAITKPNNNYWRNQLAILCVQAQKKRKELASLEGEQRK